MSSTLFIIGATSGFGETCARRFTEAGWSLVLAGRREERLQTLAGELSTKTRVSPLILDVRDHAAMDAIMDNLPEKFVTLCGPISNTDLALGTNPTQSCGLDDWDTMVGANIKGLLYSMRPLLPRLIAHDAGANIVNLDSMAGKWPYPGSHVYGGTKTFVEQFSPNLRCDLQGTGVRVTNLEPGLCESKFSLVRSDGDQIRYDKTYAGAYPIRPEDIAGTVFWIINQPAHLNINSLEIISASQSWAGLATHRESQPAETVGTRYNAPVVPIEQANSMSKSGQHIPAELCRLIASDELAAGERIVKIPTAERLQVLRMPIRIALRALKQEDLLCRTGRGYRVRTMIREGITGTVEVRGVLEGLAARRATERDLSAEARATLGECLAEGNRLFADGQVPLEKLERYQHMNMRFHRTIIETNGNPAIAVVLAHSDHLPFASTSALAVGRDDLKQEFRRFNFAHMQHHTVIDALINSQGARAGAVMREHANATLCYVDYLDPARKGVIVLHDGVAADQGSSTSRGLRKRGQ